MFSHISVPPSRDDKIAQDRTIANFVMTANEIFKISLATYILGLFWYRCSDYLLQKSFEEDDERFWVV